MTKANAMQLTSLTLLTIFNLECHDEIAYNCVRDLSGPSDFANNKLLSRTI